MCSSDLEILKKELMNKIKSVNPDEIFFYGTGCSNTTNVKMIKNALKFMFPKSKILVDHDLMGAAKSLYGNEKGIACILGTGSNSCFYNGKKIVKNSPGLGYVLGDEGSGSYLGKMVLQHHLSHIFEPDLQDRFLQQYPFPRNEILQIGRAHV